MSKLEELIKEFCPNGVEYKKLTDIASVLYGYPCDAALFNESGKGRPLARIRDVLAGRTNTYSTENVPEKYILSKGDLLVGMDGNFHTAIWQVDNAIICQRVCKIYSKDENILLNGFLFHLLRPLMRQIENNKQSGTVKHLLDKDIKAIVIPLPALPVQREIVRILDSFTLYSAELTAELTARRKQYEFYRDKLLNFENFVEKRKLEECCNILDNKRKPITQSARVAGIYPYYGANGIQDYVAEYLFDGEFILVGEDGSVITENGNPIITWAVGKIWVNNHAHIIQNNGKVNFRFLFHYLHIIDIKKLVHGNIPKLTGKDFKELQIPIPPMDVQERIVKVLDNFDAICSDLGIGLPAEIEKRQKQYEYYRDKLLSFDINVDKVINTTGGGNR